MTGPHRRPSPTEARRLELLSHALWYAAQGWAVLPLRAGRASLDAKLTASIADASTDPDRIAEWWPHRDNPDHHCNVGIATGGASNLYVVEVLGWLRWEELRREHGHVSTYSTSVPAGPSPSTLGLGPTGGTQYYYRSVDNWRPCTRSVLGAGINTHGDGGWVVAPPSYVIDQAGIVFPVRIHDGEAYGPEGTTTPPVSPLPCWIEERLRAY